MPVVMTDHELRGKRVVSQDGRVVGEIDSLQLDVESWKVLSIGVKVRKDVLDKLSLRRPFIGTQVIRISAAQISGASDTVVLKPPFADVTFEGGDPSEGQQEDSESEIRLGGLFDDSPPEDDD